MVPDKVSAASTPAETTLVKTITPDVKPVSDFPKVDAIKKADIPQQPATATASQPVVAQDTSKDIPKDISKDAGGKNLQGELDQALAKISQLEKDLSEQNAQLRERHQEAEAPAADVQALKDKVAELEKKLAAKDSKGRDKTQVVQLGNQSSSAGSLRHTTSKISRKAKTLAPKEAKQSRAVAEPSFVKNQLVLKSARPGAAVIGHTTTGDLVAIKVGDAVPGLGRITSIRNTSTGWVVQGTQGSLGE